MPTWLSITLPILAIIVSVSTYFIQRANLKDRRYGELCASVSKSLSKAYELQAKLDKYYASIEEISHKLFKMSNDTKYPAIEMIGRIRPMSAGLQNELSGFIYRLENFDFGNVRIQKAWALFLSIDSKLVKLERQLNFIDELVNMVPGIVEKVDLNCEGTKSAATDA